MAIITETIRKVTQETPTDEWPGATMTVTTLMADGDQTSPGTWKFLWNGQLDLGTRSILSVLRQINRRQQEVKEWTTSETIDEDGKVQPKQGFFRASVWEKIPSEPTSHRSPITTYIALIYRPE